MSLEDAMALVHPKTGITRGLYRDKDPDHKLVPIRVGELRRFHAALTAALVSAAICMEETGDSRSSGVPDRTHNGCPGGDHEDIPPPTPATT